jgi:hypothetical protein
MEKNLTYAATSGDRLATLRALRDRLAEEIDASKSARDIASLSKQMTEVLEQIDKIESSKSGDEVTILETVLIKHRSSVGAQSQPPAEKAITRASANKKKQSSQANKTSDKTPAQGSSSAPKAKTTKPA